MNNSAIKYRAYKALLEVNLTDQQRKKLIEANIFQKIADFFGAGKDTLSTDLKKIFQNNKLGRRAATAKKNIEKEIDELLAIAKDAGVSKEAVFDMLNLTLNDRGISPAEVASPPRREEGGSDEGSSEEIPAGRPIQLTRAAVAPLARAAASVMRQDPDRAAEQAAEKKVDAPKATQVLAKSLSSVTKVEAGKVAKILDFLIKNNHMLAEGRRVNDTDIKKVTNDLKKIQEDRIVLERWNSISGLKQILTEAPDDVKKKKFEDVIDDLRKEFKADELSDDDILNVIIALDDLDGIEIK